jgi:mono/diheme cytochrome c family protein
MKRLLKVAGVALIAIVGLALAAYAVAWGMAKSRYNRTWAAHRADFPIPFPLGDAEIAELRAGDPAASLDLEAIALERAVARGERLVTARLGCNGCHGTDFGGQTLVDEWIFGRLSAPNLTTGKGSLTADFRASDWDLAVRHGLRPGGRTSSMPALEFTNLSDRELSDVVAYIRSRPPVDREFGATRFGPMFAYMFATGPDFVIAFDLDHAKAHAREPPASGVTAEYGEHLVHVCRGCHGPGLAGGKIEGDPEMPVVANLTPHETGLAAWSEADFLRAFREGRRPDGSAISEFMPWKDYAAMSDEELKAIYAFLRTVPPKPKGTR